MITSFRAISKCHDQFARAGGVVGGPMGAVVGGVLGTTAGAAIDEADQPREEIIIRKRQADPDVVIEG